MGTPLGLQRRGKGGPSWKAPSHRFSIKSQYKTYGDKQRKNVVNGEIIELKDDRVRSTPIAVILYEDGEKTYTTAAEGMYTGQRIQAGVKANIGIGNVLPLDKIPEGTPVFNVERIPGDGGRFVRSSGSWAMIISKDKKTVRLRMPSKKHIKISRGCRATIGNNAGGGRKEKPFVKAGNRYFERKVRNKRYPIVRGVAMNPVNHPHGGSAHHAGHSTTVSRNARAGQKVGHIAARRTGRKKR